MAGARLSFRGEIIYPPHCWAEGIFWAKGVGEYFGSPPRQDFYMPPLCYAPPTPRRVFAGVGGAGCIKFGPQIPLSSTKQDLAALLSCSRTHADFNNTSTICSCDLDLSATPQQGEICVKFSVFHTVSGVKFSEIFRFGHPNPGKRSAWKISPEFHISRHLWQRKNGEIFHSALLQGSCSD